MKALCWMGIEKLSVEDVPDPKILNPRDAIVRITRTCICGSLYLLFTVEPGCAVPVGVLGLQRQRG